MVQDGDTIMIESGSTCALLAQKLGVSSTAHPDHLTGLNPANEF